MTPAELNALSAPQFWRRVSCALYEQLVLLGVIALTFLVPNLALGIAFGVSLPSWLTFLYLYTVLGIYFVWYWTKSGQTLAMQTWRVRIITQHGDALDKRKAIWRYLADRPKDDRAFCTGALKPLNRVSLLHLLVRLGERAGVTGVHPHRFRHTFAINFLRNGGDLFSLKRLLGHSDLAMVEHYLALAQSDDETAHRKASPVDNWRL